MLRPLRFALLWKYPKRWRAATLKAIQATKAAANQRANGLDPPDRGPERFRHGWTNSDGEGPNERGILTPRKRSGIRQA